VHVEPIFVPLDPPFVVNFASNDTVRFLQVTVQAMTEAPLTAEMLKKHDPIIRNSLLMLFSGQSYETLSTTAGKEHLRLAALEAVRKVVVEAGGKKDDVKDLYFTSFVMQ
jgi:flagellar FliL protein